MTHAGTRLVMGAAMVLGAAGAMAHPGHAVPAGVPAHDHLHLANGLILPGFTLVALAVGVVAVGLLAARAYGRRRAADRGGEARDNRRNAR